MDKKCQLFWCHKKHYALGYCVAHYRAVKRFGSPLGKHIEEYQQILDIIMDAQFLSRMVLTQEPIPGEQCPFCKLIHPQHSESCIMKTAHRILDKTQWHG